MNSVGHIRVTTVDDGGQRSSIESKENGPQDRAVRDTTGEFDRMGLDVVHINCLESIVKMGLNQQRTVL